MKSSRSSSVDFSRMMGKRSRRVTLAWILFGLAKTGLLSRKIENV